MGISPVSEYPRKGPVARSLGAVKWQTIAARSMVATTREQATTKGKTALVLSNVAATLSPTGRIARVPSPRSLSVMASSRKVARFL